MKSSGVVNGRRGELSPQTSRMLKEGYRRIEAKEPNFMAQPDKPVLRRPGQPSRLRLNGKTGKTRLLFSSTFCFKINSAFNLS